MPALNIIAIHETVRNSGASSSRPSGIRAVLADREPQREDDEPARRQDERPAAAGDDRRRARLWRPCSAKSVPNTPQAMNATMSPAATPNTTRSNGKCCASPSSCERRRLERWNNPVRRGGGMVSLWPSETASLAGCRRTAGPSDRSGLRPRVHGNVSSRGISRLPAGPWHRSRSGAITASRPSAGLATVHSVERLLDVVEPDGLGDELLQRQPALRSRSPLDQRAHGLTPGRRRPEAGSADLLAATGAEPWPDHARPPRQTLDRAVRAGVVVAS